MQIYVFDRNLNFTGAIDNYSSLRWRRRFNQFSEFELHCPLNADTLSLLIRGNIICKSDFMQEAGFIEYRELQQNEQGEEFLVIKGRFLKSYFNRRIIWAQELLNTTYETAMRTLVNDHCIVPTNVIRTVLVGGRNLILDSGFENSNLLLNWNSASQGNWYTGAYGIRDTIHSNYGSYSCKCGNGSGDALGIAEKNQGTSSHAAINGQIYELAFDVYSTDAATQYIQLIRCYDALGNNVSGTITPPIGWSYSPSFGALFVYKTIPSASLWNRIVAQFTVPVGVDYISISLEYYTGGTLKYVWFDNVKFELGNKATQWTPAPEDPQGPMDTDRIIPNLQLGTLKNYVGNINYQVTYNNLFDELINLSNLSNLGFRILLDTVNKKLNFDVYQGLDRTAGQAINPRCIFSMDFDNILSQNYIDSSNNLKNVALVAGVGVGSARKLVAVGSSSGLDRFEMFVDANNLSNINSVDSSVIADATYLPMLTAKGTADLALTSDIKTFDSKVNTNSNLIYKTDYDLGDKVTCLNKKWGLTMDTVIVEIEEIYEAQGTKINVIFGNNIPTLADKIKIISGQQQGGGASGDSIPAGQVSHFAMASAPSGWLKADGALVNRVTYAALYAAIGIVFGAGDGSTTFNVPDMRGSFARGLDSGKGLDTGRVLGSYQADDNKSHTHNTTALVNLNGADGTYDWSAPSTSVGTKDFDMRATTSNAVGIVESRPKNVALLACIKY